MQRGNTRVSSAGVRGQGATEYLLILVVVLGVATVAIFFLIAAPPSAIITGVAEKSGDNVVFVPSQSMTPDTISSDDWEWAIYRGAIQIASGSGTEDLKKGMSVALTAPDAASGDEVKIKYDGTWHSAATVI